MTQTVEVIVEIPRGSRNKYEFDHERGIMRLDRRLFSATVYPSDYGFIPETLAEDGDPLDALVLLEEPSFPGCLIVARPLGMLLMTDEAGRDAKIISVLDNEPRWAAANELSDLPGELLAEIEHFFSVYKMLEPGKKAVTKGFSGRDVAWGEIEKCRSRFHGRP